MQKSEKRNQSNTLRGFRKKKNKNNSYESWCEISTQNIGKTKKYCSY